MTLVSSHRGWVALLGACAIAATGFVIVLGSIKVDRTAPGNLHSLWPYWPSFAALWMGLSALAWWVAKVPEPRAARRIAGPAACVLAGAAALRISTVLVSTPQLSDDLWRYAHDGHVLGILHQNPYERPPSQRASPHAPLVNHGDLVSIYQPTSQWVFAGFSVLVRATDHVRTNLEISPRWWTADVLFRLGFAAIDVLIVAVLIAALLRRGRSVWWAALYAWHPLAISEVGHSGHQDVIGILGLVVGLAAVDAGMPARQKGNEMSPHRGPAPETREREAWPWAIVAGGAFALAIGVKPLVAPVALLLAWAWRRRPLQALGAAGTCVFVLAALYVPFALMEGGLGPMVQTVRSFLAHWAFNSSVHALMVSLLGKTPANVVLALVLGAVLVGAMVRCDPWRALLLYLLAALLLSSTVHPWYLLWALALVPIHFSPTAWIFSLTIGWSYAVLDDPVAWDLPSWVRVVEYAPVFAVMAWGIHASRRDELPAFRPA